jgi:hypothetical protein
MDYLIQIPDELDHLVRQMCDSCEKPQSKAVSPEEFLSAFLEEKLNELFARRERPKTGKNKKVAGAVRSAKERAKTWREAATLLIPLSKHCVSWLQKLQWSQSRIRRGNRVNSLNFHAEAAHCEVK